MNELTVSRLLHVVLYLLGFLILWEWIRPLEKISDVGDSHYFVIFIVLMLIVDFFSIKLLWKLLLVFLYITFASYSLYYGSNPMFGLGWFMLFVGDFINSIQAIVQLDWNGVTNSFRTFLFFIMLWMMTYLLRYWLLVRRSILLFVFLSMAFVATLDTFTQYDGDWAIIRLFIFGVILLGVLMLIRLTDDDKIAISIAEYPRWFIALCALIALGISVGYFAPKPVAQWPDPVPFIISTSEKFTGNGSTANTVGYDEDDSKLGGDFIPDDTVVFTSRSDSRHYWFIESKYEYTGIGWETPALGDELLFAAGDTLWGARASGSETDLSAVKTDSVNIQKKENYILQPSPLNYSMIFTDNQINEFSYDAQTSKMTVGPGEDYEVLESYNVTYRTQVYPIDKLRSAGTEEIEIFYPNVDFTQLPEGLPARIKELAESITEEETNVYDKAKAIERYFDSGEFTYAREDVPYPEEGEDFVDQFLFDSKRGYCDHFSTSMVVMLRSLDIPARWVKGYSAGTYIGVEDGDSLYEVTNNNAHSWVEVYLNGFGWVPFEPTKGYDMNIDIQYNLSLNSSQTNPSQPSQTPQPQPQEEQQPMVPEKETTSQAKQELNAGEQIKEHLTDNWKTYVLIVSGIATISFLVFALRGKWMPRIWLWRYKRSHDDEVFFKAYGALLKELSRYGLKKQPEQTLREYAHRVDQHFSSAEMEKLTSYYEKTIYGNRNASAMWSEVKPLWESMMKKTIT